MTDLRAGSRAAARAWTGALTDARRAVRILVRQWGFTAVVALTLALAIGSTAALVSAVRTILIQPLPYAGAPRLVNVWLTRSGRPNWHFHVPPSDFEVMRATNHVFEAMTFYDTDIVSLTGDGGSRDAAAATVSADSLRHAERAGEARAHVGCR